MQAKENNRAKLIYNPHAGGKRTLVTLHSSTSLEDITALLAQYQLPVDLFPTKYKGHATKLAHDAIKEGYSLVLSAGGDGTLGEIINGLIGTDITLGILPLGSVMNVARMLGIPHDIEKAIMLLKIGRTRKIDAASITEIDGKKIAKPHYFLEESGIGIEAQVHYYLTGIFERGEYVNIFKIFSVLWRVYQDSTTVSLDGKSIETKAKMVIVSNGPLGGAALKLAPRAKLNDHRLTVSLYRMNKWQITVHLLKLLLKDKAYSPKITTYQAKQVRLEAKHRKLIHADARIFGTTPVTYEVVPNALNVITGFPTDTTPALEKRTLLDP